MNTMTRHRWFYLWLMPVLWLPCAVLSAFHPGDKGLSLLFATFPGEWLRHVLNLHFGLPSVVSRIAGALVVVLIAGAVMDVMRVPKKLCVRLAFAGLVLGAAFVLKVWYLGLDFLFLLLCWMIYFVATLSVAAETGRRVFRRLARIKPCKATSGSAPRAAPKVPEG